MLQCTRAGRAVWSRSLKKHAQSWPLLILLLSPVLQVAQEAVVCGGALAAHLPPDSCASVMQGAMQWLEARAGAGAASSGGGPSSEDAAVAAVRLFAHTASSWAAPVLATRTPELLRRWCGHRSFAVREVCAEQQQGMLKAGLHNDFLLVKAGWPRTCCAFPKIVLLQSIACGSRRVTRSPAPTGCGMLPEPGGRSTATGAVAGHTFAVAHTAVP